MTNKTAKKRYRTDPEFRKKAIKRASERNKRLMETDPLYRKWKKTYSDLGNSRRSLEYHMEKVELAEKKILSLVRALESIKQKMQHRKVQSLKKEQQ